MVFNFLRRKNSTQHEALRAVCVLRNAFATPQRDAIDQWCENNNARIITWIEGDFPFGAPWHRPELEAWLTSRPPTTWDVLVVHSMEQMTAVELLEPCRDHGKRLVLTEGRADSSTWQPPWPTEVKP